MADAFQILPDDAANTGKKIDLNSAVVAGVTVYRQRIEVGNVPEVTDQATASIDDKTPALVGGAVPVNLVAASGTLTTSDAATASMDAKTPALVAGAVPVVQASQVSAQTDRSGTITAGGTAQVLMAANASRKGWWLQNNSTGDLWVNDVGTATAGGGSIRVPGNGGLYESPARVSPSAISIFGATTGQVFAAREN